MSDIDEALRLAMEVLTTGRVVAHGSENWGGLIGEQCDCERCRLARALIAVAAENERLKRELEWLKQPTIIVVDRDSCRHNTAIDPDTGECLMCEEILPCLSG